MSNNVLSSIGYFPDPTKGRPVALGSVYIGEPDKDPEFFQIQVTALQENGSQVEILQPIDLSAGGVPIYNGSPVSLYVNERYSLKVLDSLGSQVYYIPNSPTSGDVVAEGILPWNSTVTYPVGAITKGSDNNIYIAVTAQSGNDPVSDDGTNWENWFIKSSRDNAIVYFSNVIDMKSKTSTDGGVVVMSVGNVVETLGRVTPGDGGPARYEVVALGTPDGFTTIGADDSSVQFNLTPVNGYINNIQCGSVADGVTDDSDAIESMEDYSYNLDMTPTIQGDILISRDLEFRRSLNTTGFPVIRSFYDGSDVSTLINVYFSRPTQLTEIIFNYVNVHISAVDVEEQRLLTRTKISMCSFVTCNLTIGQEQQITSGYVIEKCQFADGTSRDNDAVTVQNCNNVTIDGVDIQDYRYSIHVNPSYSLAANNISIKNSSMVSFGEAGIYLHGTSIYRINQTLIDNCTIGSSIRDAALQDRGAILPTFTCGLEVNNCVTSSSSPVINAQGCIDTTVKNTTITGGEEGQACFRFVGCPDTKMLYNTIYSPGVGSYVGLVLSNDLSSFVSANRYDTVDFQMIGGHIIGTDTGVKFDGAFDSLIAGVDFDMSDQIDTVGLVWSVNGTRVRAYNNQYRAVTGGSSPTNGDIIIIPPDANLIPITVAAPSVTAPVINASDPALDNSKSYVVEFTLGDVKQLTQLAEGNSPKKTLTNWLTDAGVLGSATLAWNSAAFNVVTGYVNDMIVNGAVLDNFGVEETGKDSRRSAVVIDMYNRLNCCFFGVDAAKSVPLGQASKLMNQRAWQSAAFRPPMIIDSIIADYLIDEDSITSDNWYTQISGRMCIGQKADGTYILLAVDGVSDVSGTTILKCASKLLALGCEQAFNLDGGGSVTLWYNGAVINTPSDGSEREIPAVMYV